MNENPQEVAGSGLAIPTNDRLRMLLKYKGFWPSVRF